MSFIYDKPVFPGGSKPAGGMASLGAIWEASIEQMRMVDNVNASTVALGDAYDQRIAAVKAVTGQELRNPLRMTREDMIALGPNRVRDVAPLIKEFDDRLYQLAAQFPQFSEEIGATRPVARDAERIAREADETLGQLLASRPGWESFVTSLGGGMMGSLEDPAQLVTLGIGAGAGTGRTMLARVLGTAVREAVVNGAVEAAFQPVVQDWRRRAGLPNGLGEAASNVGFAMLGGAVLGAGFHALGEGVARLMPRRVSPELRDRAAARAAAAEGVSEKMRAALAGDPDAAAEVLEPIRATQPAVVRGALDERARGALDDAQLAAAPRTQSVAEVLSPADIDPNRAVELGTIFRGVEGGTDSVAALRVFQGGDVGDGIYLTPSERIASSYGGGPGANVIDGTRVVHTYSLTRPLFPDEVAYVFGGAREGDDAVLVSGTGVEFWRGKWSGAAIEAALKGEDGIKAVVGTPGSVGLNQIAIRDASILQTGAAMPPSTKAALATRATEGDAVALDELAAADPKLAPRVQTGAAYPTRAPDLSALDDPFDANQLTAALSEYEGFSDDLLTMPTIDENGDVVPLADLLDDARHEDGLSRLVAACML